MKEALTKVQAIMIKECLRNLEKTAFLFPPYKEKDEKKNSCVYTEHLKAMARKIIEAFDQKSETVQDFIIAYEAIKAVIVAIDEALDKLNRSNNKRIVII